MGWQSDAIRGEEAIYMSDGEIDDETEETGKHEKSSQIRNMRSSVHRASSATADKAMCNWWLEFSLSNTCFPKVMIEWTWIYMLYSGCNFSNIVI